jgi:hypothetical protein
MTYEELNAIILRGDRREWLYQGAFLVYKGDLNLRIETVDSERSATGESFSEDWSDAIPSLHPPTRQVFWIHYCNTRVLEVYTVLIDQRTIVPLPDSDDHSTMSAWNYGFGKIVEEYSQEYGGAYSLDTFLNRAGITVRPN